MPRNYLEQTTIGRKFFNIEYRLILFLLYLIFLLFLLVWGYGWKTVVWIHISFVFIFSIYYFGRQFIYILVAPLIAVFLPIHQYFFKKYYLSKFKQNVPAEAVIVLAHSDWRKLEAWIKPNFIVNEIQALVKYLNAKGQNFSFYPNANFADVEIIMSDKSIKEVCFFGHGSSHVFQLNTDDILYYCDFNNAKYGKEFVHQVHCGTKDGKSLVDYVVPEKNKSGCFLIRKSITGPDIIKEFKRKTKSLIG